MSFLKEMVNAKRSNGVSVFENSLGTRVMTGVCVIGQALSYVVEVDSDPSAMLLFVISLGYVFWMGVFTDAFRFIESVIQANRLDQRFYIYAGLFDLVLLAASLPLIWCLPAYGNSLYAIAIVPVAVPVILLSLYRLYLTVQGVRRSR